MHINSNIPSLRAHGQLLISNREQGVSMRRLSTGFSVNRTSEDPASMAIANRMRREIDGMVAARQNSLDAISILQTADATLNETLGILNRVRDLIVQASNDSLGNINREAIQMEIDQLLDEIDRITTQAAFNNRSIFAGTFEDSEGNIHGVKQVRVGTRENVLLDINIPSIHTSLLGRCTTPIEIEVMEQHRVTDGLEPPSYITDPDTGEYIYHDVVVTHTLYSIDALRNPNSNATRIPTDDTDSPSYPYEYRFGVLDRSIGENDSVLTFLIQILDVAIRDVADIRARIGAYENRLFVTHENLQTQSEQLTESLSRIVDTDMALEMSRLTQQQLLFQATISVKAMSNQRPQILLAMVNF